MKHLNVTHNMTETLMSRNPPRINESVFGMIKKYDYFIGNRRTAKEVSRRKIQEGSNSDHCELGGGVTNRNTETCQRNVQVISVLTNTAFEEIKLDLLSNLNYLLHS